MLRPGLPRVEVFMHHWIASPVALLHFALLVREVVDASDDPDARSRLLAWVCDEERAAAASGLR